MPAPSSDWCYTFCTPDNNRPGEYQIQWQFPGYTITCTSLDLGFAQKILDFVAETRGNPAYRDIPLGNGVYRYMDEKSIELSKYFHAIELQFEKSGESDDDYLLKYMCSDRLSLIVELRSPERIDSFLDGISEIVDDFAD